MIGLFSSGWSVQITSDMVSHGTQRVRSGLQHGCVTSVAPDRTTIAELRVGGQLRGIFACTRKDRLVTKGGSPYLAVELQDRGGSIAGRAFRDADFLAAQFERGD